LATVHQRYKASKYLLQTERPNSNIWRTVLETVAKNCVRDAIISVFVLNLLPSLHIRFQRSAFIVGSTEEQGDHSFSTMIFHDFSMTKK